MELFTFFKPNLYFKIMLMTIISCLGVISFGTVNLDGQISQSREITGEVRDSLGTLSGVSISVKSRPGIGTSTDINGKFILSVPSDNPVLVFNMVGYETQEINVGNRTTINVVLKASVSNLDEVVVVAFGTQKKTDVIGAI